MELNDIKDKDSNIFDSDVIRKRRDSSMTVIFDGNTISYEGRDSKPHDTDYRRISYFKSNFGVDAKPKISRKFEPIERILPYLAKDNEYEIIEEILNDSYESDDNDANIIIDNDDVRDPNNVEIKFKASSRTSKRSARRNTDINIETQYIKYNIENYEEANEKLNQWRVDYKRKQLKDDKILIFSTIWNSLLLFTILYYFVVLTFRIACYFDNDYSNTILLIDSCFDSIFWLNIIFRSIKLKYKMNQNEVNKYKLSHSHKVDNKLDIKNKNINISGIGREKNIKPKSKHDPKILGRYDSLVRINTYQSKLNQLDNVILDNITFDTYYKLINPELKHPKSKPNMQRRKSIQIKETVDVSSILTQMNKEELPEQIKSQNKVNILGSRGNIINHDHLLIYNDLNFYTIIIDIVLMLPYGVVAKLLFNSNSWSIFRIPRIFLFFTSYRYLKPLFEIIDETDINILKKVILPGPFRVLKLWFLMCLSCHVCGCGLLLVHQIEIRNNDQINTWAINDDITFRAINDNNVWFQYLRSIYWAVITMITTGLGDIVPITIPETIFVIFTQFTGMVITCAVIGNITTLMVNNDSQEALYQRKMDFLNNYMNYRKLPNDLRKRIYHYNQYMWQNLKGFNENVFLQQLPLRLQKLVSAAPTIEYIKYIPIFAVCPNHIVSALASAMEPQIFAPNTYILKQGTLSDIFYIVTKGKLLKNETYHLNKGDYLNYCGLFIPQKILVTYQAIGYCEVHTLSKSKFEKIIRITKLSNIIYKKMRNIVQYKINANNNVNYEHISELDIINETSWIEKINKHDLFSPDSTFRFIWSILFFLIIAYLSFTSAYELLYIVPNVSIPSSIKVRNHILDSYFYIDLIFNSFFFTFYHDGALITLPNFIFERYKKTWFWYDIAAAFPFDILIYIYPSTFKRYYGILRLNRNIRFIHCSDFFDNFDRWIIRKKLHINRPLRRIFKLAFVMMYLVFWLGCFWFIIGQTQQKNNNLNWIDMDLNIVKTHGNGDIGIWGILRSVYFVVVAMTTVGYGDIVPYNIAETLYAMIIVLFGGLLYPSWLAIVASLILNFDVSKVKFLKETRILRKFITHRKVQPQIADRILAYYDHLWYQTRGINEASILCTLPKPLRIEVGLWINKASLSKINFFENIENDELFKRIIFALEPKMFLPYDWLIHAGEYNQALYLIKKGKVGIYDKNGVFLLELTDGSSVGESALRPTINGKKTFANAGVQAFDYCDCFALTRRAFKMIIMEYPDYIDTVIDKVTNDLNKKNEENKTLLKKLNSEEMSESNNKLYNDEKVLNEQENILDTSKFNENIDIMSYKEATKNAYEKNGLFTENHKFRRIWNLLALIGVVYNLYIIPWRITFLSNFEDSLTGKTLIWFIIDYFGDMFWWFDIYFRAKKWTEFKNGTFEITLDSNSKKKDLHFILDVIGALPYDIFLIIFIIWFKNYNLVYIASLFRLPRLCRVSRVFQYLNSCEKWIEEISVTFVLSIMTVIKLFVGVLLLCHWFACIFYLMTEYASYDTFTWVDHQLLQDYLADHSSSLSYWLRSFYWAMPSILVVVIGDVTPNTNSETLYVFIAIVLGATVNAALIGIIADLANNYGSLEVAFQTKINQIIINMQKYKLPRQLRYRITSYYDFVYRWSGGINSESILQDLPYVLSHDVQYFNVSHCFITSYLFKNIDEVILRSFAMVLKPLFFNPGNIIYEENEINNECYFLHTGKIKRYRGNEYDNIDYQFIDIIEPNQNGGLFGEISCFLKVPCYNNTVAITHCALYVLSIDDIDNILYDESLDNKEAIATKLKMIKLVRLKSNNNEKKRSNIKRSKSDSILYTLSSKKQQKNNHNYYTPNNNYRQIDKNNLIDNNNENDKALLNRMLSFGGVSLPSNNNNNKRLSEFDRDILIEYRHNKKKSFKKDLNLQHHKNSIEMIKLGSISEKKQLKKKIKVQKSKYKKKKKKKKRE